MSGDLDIATLMLAWQDSFRTYDWGKALPVPALVLSQVRQLLALVQSELVEGPDISGKVLIKKPLGEPCGRNNFGEKLSANDRNHLEQYRESTISE